MDGPTEALVHTNASERPTAFDSAIVKAGDATMLPPFVYTDEQFFETVEEYLCANADHRCVHHTRCL